jgi:hypothetical protein
MRRGDSAANFSVIRHIALNMLRHEKSSKVGIKNKQLTAAWDNGYLLKVLGVKKNFMRLPYLSPSFHSPFLNTSF